MIGKKGIAAPTLGELIIVIAGGIIILWIVIAIAGFVSPTASSVGCGLNVRVHSAILTNTKGIAGAPMVLCNQYRTPVDINAANFRACPGIADFCRGAKDDLLVECWKQCARIQVDRLTDSCWSMAGSGRLDISDDALKKLGGIPQDQGELGLVILGGAIGGVLGGRGGVAAGASLVALGIVVLKDQAGKVLRCYRFRITNPVVGPDRKLINYEDGSLGRSWAYSLNSTNLSDPGICRPTAEDPICSFGGTGVKYINDEFGEVQYEIRGEEIRVPAKPEDWVPGALMNYNISNPRTQVCYISYYQGKGGTEKFALRSCKSWSKHIQSPSYVN